jgi:hypothetical protein
MLLLNPRRVTFADETWEDVVAVSIDRAAAEEALEWGDLGPHVVFADVPRQRVTIRVVQELSRDDLGAPRPAEEGEISFFTSPATSDAWRRKVSARAVVMSVSHEVSLRRASTRTVTLVAVSEDGSADPVSVTPAEDGEG